jgi:hypothetical protein
MGEAKRRAAAEYAAIPDGERLGDAPVEEEYHQKMVATMGAVDQLFNGPPGPDREKKTGIVIMVFPYGDKTGRCNYMSNGADRADIVTLMREMIARFEGQPEQPLTRA